jgi:hypothetical protein
MSSIFALPTKSILDPAKFKAVIEQALDSEAKRVKTVFENTASDWDDEPTFAIKSSSGQREISTSHKIYGFVNKGTAPHMISPINRLFLAFPGSFSPKTRPGQLGSSGGHTGGPEVFTSKSVHHPGTKPRNFDKLIAKEAQSLLTRAVNSAIASVVR